jgi:hypothetical protein
VFVPAAAWHSLPSWSERNWLIVLFVIAAALELAGIVIAWRELAIAASRIRGWRRRPQVISGAGGIPSEERFGNAAIEMKATSLLSTSGQLGIIKGQVEALQTELDTVRQSLRGFAGQTEAQMQAAQRALSEDLQRREQQLAEATGLFNDPALAFTGLALIAAGLLLGAAGNIWSVCL